MLVMTRHLPGRTLWVEELLFRDDGLSDLECAQWPPRLGPAGLPQALRL
jgi:hypothetical protein